MKNKRKVYLVQHEHKLNEDQEDIKVIGIYSSHESANKAVRRAKLRPGFKKSKRGFFVDEYALDEDHWVEGFVTIKHKSKTKREK